MSAGERASARMSEMGVCVRNAAKSFGGVGVVNDVTFELPRGLLLALLGPSGCGKTTPLRLIAGFERLDSGEVEIGGIPVASAGKHVPPERRRIGMVFQEYAPFPHLTVAENVRYGLHAYAGDRDRRVAVTLEMVGLSGLENRDPHELSGGQQQRVALARALAPDPDVLLLDEPFSNLDAALRVRVRSEVRSILRHANATAIFVTHDQEEALSLVDIVAVIIEGKVRQVASPQELYQRPIDRDVASFVGDANFLPGTANGRSVECQLGRLELVREQSGPVDVLVRPENVRVAPAGKDARTRVENVLFFGHDQLISVRLPTGSMIDARMDPMYHFALGQPVSVSIVGPVLAYRRHS